jgi:hypothetical protein
MARDNAKPAKDSLKSDCVRGLHWPKRLKLADQLY